MVDLLKHQMILIVDDSAEDIEILTKTLLGEYRTEVLTDGLKALNVVFSDNPPDLILLNNVMPGFSGLEICRRVKANPDRRLIPIIFLTSMSTVEDERRGFALGAVDYIARPISPPIVLSRVRTHLALYDQARELEHMVLKRTNELLASRRQILRHLGHAVEYRDNETGKHVFRMAHYARLIAISYGLGSGAVEYIFNTAPLHDTGKIGIPDSILLKPGKLNAQEKKIMQKHPIIGAEIIGNHGPNLMHVARMIALTHHERWDGLGYPYGLKGNDIPIEGRIVAIADVFDALMSPRCYKGSLSFNGALRVIEEEEGHFDPDLMVAFHKVIPDLRKIAEVYSDARV